PAPRLTECTTPRTGKDPRALWEGAPPRFQLPPPVVAHVLHGGAEEERVVGARVQGTRGTAEDLPAGLRGDFEEHDGALDRPDRHHRHLGSELRCPTPRRVHHDGSRDALATGEADAGDTVTASGEASRRRVFADVP